jgi:hypothetical protein
MIKRQFGELVSHDDDGFTVHFSEPEQMTRRRVYVSMGRSVIVETTEDFSIWEVLSNYHRGGYSFVSNEGLRELL